MAAKRSPNEARKGKKAPKPVFRLDLGLDVLDLDFDPDDFDIIDGGKEKKPKGQPQRDVRILRPTLDRNDIAQRVAFENAEAFARQIDLTPGSRVFAWVSGNSGVGGVSSPYTPHERRASPCPNPRTRAT